MSDSTHTLPIDALHGDFTAALERGHVVVSAATGSGKSTRLPVWAAERGPVLVIEPRRLAATSLATFVAAGFGEEPGGRVGYAIRLDARYGDGTEIVFATPGIALRWLASGRLNGFATVVLDEFHERRWDTDLLLALLAGWRQPPRLVVTSATIDGDRMAGHLDARQLHSDVRGYDVEVAYCGAEAREMPQSAGLAPRVAKAVRRALDETAGDVLVFLPGRREIREAASALQGGAADVIGLHASAPAADQRRALTLGAQRRVILATNVAETSLTVPGVTAVVDSGLERRTLRRNGRTVLALQAIARSGADQRKGRAGRTAPGLCLRLWGSQAPMQRVTPPEVQREDLTELVLAAACAGQPAATLGFVDALPEAALASAQDRLAAIGAVDEAGVATERGQRLFALPVDAWLAHLVVAMPDSACAGFMADLAAALASGGLVAPPRDPDERDRLSECLGRRCDATLQVAALRGVELPAVAPDRRDLREARRLAARLREAMELPAMPGHIDVHPSTVFEAAAAALPEMAYVRRARRREALGNGGSEALVSERSLLGEDDEAALVFDDHSVPARRGTRRTVTVATCLAPLALSALAVHGVARANVEAPAWDGERLTVTMRWYHAGRLVDEAQTTPTGEAARAAIADLVLAGRLLAPAGERLVTDIEAWSLYVALGHGEGEVPEPREWLQQRLAALGVDAGDDLVLIEPGDLAFEGIPSWERERFDRTYPRAVSLTDLDMRVHYDVRRRTVTVEKVAGTRKRDPQRWELPAWSGWRVAYKRASRVVEVR